MPKFGSTHKKYYSYSYPNYLYTRSIHLYPDYLYSKSIRLPRRFGINQKSSGWDTVKRCGWGQSTKGGQKPIQSKLTGILLIELGGTL